MLEPDLLLLAGSVSDGDEVDWSDAEKRSSSDEARRIVRNLRLLSSLSSFHRAADSADTRDRPRHGHETGDTVSLLDEPALSRPVALPTDAPRSWGGFEIRAKIGEGSYGEVFRAWDPKLQRDVALKLLKRDAASRRDLGARVLHEARLLARIDHPNIVTVYGADEHEGRVGLWMELVRGRSLEVSMKDQGRLGARESAMLGVELCRALAAVHRVGLVHRDVKAGNVMREEGGRILLMDFGAGSDAQSIEEGSLSGTPLYIAPEAFGGQKPTPRSDIFSLGVLLYHLVTASYPINAGTFRELREKVRRRESRLLRDERPDLPEPFVKVVERALAWDPTERFQTAGELEQGLSAFLGRDAGATLPRGGVPEGRSPRRWALGLGGILMVAATVISLLMIDRGRLPGWRDATSTKTDGTVAANAKDPAAGSAGSPSVPFGVSGAADRLPDQPGRDRVVTADGVDGAASAAANPGSTAPSSVVIGTPYSVEASFWRVRRNGRRERLEPGAKLALGDRLSLDLKASRSLHVYVLDEDDRGHAYALFPLPGLELQNPLSAGQSHVLPGQDADGTTNEWSVTSVGGQEHLLVLASPERLVDFEAEMARLPRPQPGEAGIAIPEDVKVRLRGIGGLVQSSKPRASHGDGTKLFELAETLAGHSEQVQGPWLRRIDLENP